VHKWRGGPFYILDTQKAPLWTVPSGLDFLARARSHRKTAVFGTISDYSGKDSRTYRSLALEALAIADRVVFVGPNAAHVSKLREGELQDRLFAFQTCYQASAFLAEEPFPGELIYVKASITDHLERVMLSQRGSVVCWRERCMKRIKLPRMSRLSRAARSSFRPYREHNACRRHW
jgi:UDP-N-acetylmuramoyl-tripeptide--D-alanyl-D-alanine ligase